MGAADAGFVNKLIKSTTVLKGVHATQICPEQI